VEFRPVAEGAIVGHYLTFDRRATTVDNSRRSARGILLLFLLLGELAQRSGLECLQGGGRGFEPLSAHNRHVVTVARALCVRSDPHSVRRADNSRSSRSGCRARLVSIEGGDAGVGRSTVV
jgi:hypothetical protein